MTIMSVMAYLGTGNPLSFIVFFLGLFAGFTAYFARTQITPLEVRLTASGIGFKYKYRKQELVFEWPSIQRVKAKEDVGEPMLPRRCYKLTIYDSSGRRSLLPIDISTDLLPIIREFSSEYNQAIQWEVEK